jgi:bis(5'-nucleosyl)-tetraphosphatase (symmetrical)
MARWAIGDVQGCAAELRELLKQLRFRADRDQLWFVGDLVNRGPESLEVLRLVRALGANAIVVLGNHDLHLLAVALGGNRERKRGDTLDAILAAPDRDVLLDWLRARPLAYRDPAHGELLIHAGLLPQWSAAQALALSAEIEHALHADPQRLLAGMYGNQPDHWDDSLTGLPRLRCAINALTRLRWCTRTGVMDLKRKHAPGRDERDYLPWFRVPGRASAGTPIVFGHWSTLGFVAESDIVALDTGCVWGGSLTAWSLERRERRSVPCAGYQEVGGD